MKTKNLLVMLVVISWILTACQSASVPPTPTATIVPSTPTSTILPAKVDSSLKSKLLGQWKISGENRMNGTWGDATLTFSDDGNFSVIGGLQEKEAKGNYFFTSENTIAFMLPSYQGSIALEFTNDDHMSLTVTKSDEVFGLIYSAERVK